MIIQHRTAGLSYGTDPIAQSLRSVIAAPAARITGRTESASPTAERMDLERLYPALFSARSRPAAPDRAIRALAIRVSLFATGALAMLAIVHH